MMTATYSPEDNKLRLYASTRLDDETYQRVKAAGFIWAPKQGLFVAPMWTPGRADLLAELCGEIGDEDTALVDRAEQRAERFETYQENRQADAAAAQKTVAAIADGIPLGQPILVGHHSERHARRDAARIENGMRKAVQMWETAEYWQRRASGAIAAAKYKERPDVRARRIKGLESDLRKQQKHKAEAESWTRRWTALADDSKWRKTAADGAVTMPTILERARHLANHCGYLVVHRDGALAWTAYDVLRPDDERGSLCPAWTPEQVQARALELFASSVARADRWIAHIEHRLAYERAMLAEAGGTLADQTKPEKRGAVRCWASPRGGWSYVQKVNRISVTVLDNYGHGGANFTRVIPFDKLAGIMTAAQVDEARAAGRLIESGDKVGFFLSTAVQEPAAAPQPDAPTPAPIDAMRAALKAGVQAVAVPQLFPTPPDLAARMVAIADPQPGHRLLEPSAGTGALLWPLYNADGTACVIDPKPPFNQLVAIEINPRLAQDLRAQHVAADVRTADFLECNGDLGMFDRIVMNPPFGKAADIAHIEHARAMLKPGGRLVALCANGPRQRERLKPIAEASGGYWEDLPAGTFAEAGTGVNVALVVIEN